jgi:hypothetical protein
MDEEVLDDSQLDESSAARRRNVKKGTKKRMVVGNVSNSSANLDTDEFDATQVVANQPVLSASNSSERASLPTKKVSSSLLSFADDEEADGGQVIDPKKKLAPKQRRNVDIDQLFDENSLSTPQVRSYTADSLAQLRSQ